MTKIIKGPLENDEWCALIQCPQCGLKAWIDREQFEGTTSIACKCGWHETHNFTEIA